MMTMQLLSDEFPFDTPLEYKKEEWSTDPQFGTPPKKRRIDDLLHFGIISLDKPTNTNSHQLAAYLKKVLEVEKIGHGGTLDPGVSGVLPIALERATPIARIWLKSDKEYVGVMRLHDKVENENIRSVIREFEGRIYQLPPKASSVKREVRKREIYELKLLEVKRRDVLLRIKCESGTYIRKLFHDIGEVLGVGAHMIDLRRTKSGLFAEDKTLKTVQDIIDAWMFYKERGEKEYLKKVIMPPEVGVTSLPRLVLDDGAISAVTHGAPIYLPGIIAISPKIEKDDLVATFTIKGEIVALVNSRLSTREVLKKKKGRFSGKMRVLMEKDVYARSWNKKEKD